MGSSAPSRSAVGEGRATHDTRAADVETASDDYARRFAGSVGSWLLDVQAESVRRLLSDHADRPLSVLDVGGGHGQLTRSLLDAGHRVVVHGSRLSCHDGIRARGLDVTHVTSSLWQLPFSESTFDLVVAIRLLAHVVDWRGLLREMSRVSRGLVLVEFPARSLLQRKAPWLFDAKRRIEGNTRPYFDYTADEIERELDESGLRVLGVRRQFTFPMVLHRTIKAPLISGALEGAAAGVGITRSVGSPVLLLAGRAPQATSVASAPSERHAGDGR